MSDPEMRAPMNPPSVGWDGRGRHHNQPTQRQLASQAQPLSR